MEPEWWTKALEAELFGKPNHGPGFYDSGRQCLHHGLWSPQAEPQRLTKNARRYSVSFCLCSSSFSAPLSLYKQFLSLRPFTVQFAPIDIHVVSMFLVLSSPDLLTSNLHNPPYLTYKHTDLSGPSEKFPAESNSRTQIQPLFIYQKIIVLHCGKQERNSKDGDKGVWYTNNTTIVPVGQTGKWRRAHVTSRCLSPLLPGSDLGVWPRHTNTVTRKLHGLKFLITMMTYEQDVIVPFPGSWWICRVNVCTAEEGVPHVTQSSGTPSQLQPHWHMSPTTGVLSNVQLSQCLTLCAMSKAWRVSVVLWTGSWWVRVNTAQSPAELLVKMEALISLYFSSVTETLIRAHANAQFIHLSGSTHSVLSPFHIIVPLNNTARRIYMPASIIPPAPQRDCDRAPSRWQTNVTIWSSSSSTTITGNRGNCQTSHEPDSWHTRKRLHSRQICRLINIHIMYGSYSSGFVEGADSTGEGTTSEDAGEHVAAWMPDWKLDNHPCDTSNPL